MSVQIAWRPARAFGLAGLLLFGCLGIAPTVAKADIFNVNATVGSIHGGGPGQFTGLSLTGAFDLDTTLGVVNSDTIIVQNDPNLFTGFLGCPASCTYIFNTGFNEFGLLDIGNPLGFTGGALQSDSYIALINPLGGPGSEVQYDLSGSVSGAVATPEPRYEALALGMSVLLFASLRRRRRSA
jgi:hypothetical protein